MKALVKAKPETGIWMQDVEKPPIGAHDVLIKIKKTAICGTDVHIYNWDKWANENVPVPLVTGHEYSGVIEEIGDEVTHLEPGMRVSGEGHIVCGHCRNCRGGQAHLCRDTIGVGVNRPGAFAEYLSLPASNVFPLSDSISDEIGALLDPLGNATHTALSFDLVGEDVIITGAGPIGILAAAIARHCGARNIVITDVNDYRLELAEDFGVTATLNATKESMAHVMQHLGMTEGFDIGLEMSGNGHAINDMIRAMRHGGEMALLGIMPDSPTLDYNKIVLKGLHLKGIYGREMFETWYKMKAMIESGLDISPIITHRFPIDDYEKGFEAMRSGESGKVILEWD